MESAATTATFSCLAYNKSIASTGVTSNTFISTPDNFCENIEDCVKTIVSSHDITKETLLDYIELEVREQLKLEV